MSPSTRNAELHQRGAKLVTPTPDEALRRAWRVWLLMSILPWLTFVAALWKMLFGARQAANQALANSWYLATTAYLIIALPVALFWRAPCSAATYAVMPSRPECICAG